MDVPGPENGLLAYYPFNSNMFDGSGNNHNVMNVSSTGLNVVANRFGKLNAAFQFDNGYMSIPSFGTNIDNFTIWARVYHDSNLSNLMGDQTIVAKAGTGREYVMKLLNRKASAYFYNPTYYHVTSDNDLPSNTWFHYALKVENTVWSIYINGVLVKSVSQPANINWGANNIVIGALTASGTERFFGKLDDLLFYGRALTNNEILAIANNLYW